MAQLRLFHRRVRDFTQAYFHGRKAVAPLQWRSVRDCFLSKRIGGTVMDPLTVGVVATAVVVIYAIHKGLRPELRSKWFSFRADTPRITDKDET